MVNYLLVSLKDNEEIEEGSYESLEALREAAKQKMDLLYSQDDFWGEKYEDGELIEKISKETFDEDEYVEKSYFGKASGSLAEQNNKAKEKEPEKEKTDTEEVFDALNDPILIKAAEETEEILQAPLVQKKKKTEQSEISMLLNALATDRKPKDNDKIIELKTLLKLLMNAINNAVFTSGKETVEVLAKQCLDIVSEITEEE